jgi:hypothetical protein
MSYNTEPGARNVKKWISETPPPPQYTRIIHPY